MLAISIDQAPRQSALLNDCSNFDRAVLWFTWKSKRPLCVLASWAFLRFTGQEYAVTIPCSNRNTKFLMSRTPAHANAWSTQRHIPNTSNTATHLVLRKATNTIQRNMFRKHTRTQITVGRAENFQRTYMAARERAWTQTIRKSPRQKSKAGCPPAVRVPHFDTTPVCL